MALSKKEHQRIAIERKNEVARCDMALGLCRLFRVLPDNCVRKEVILEQDWNGGSVLFHGVECNDNDLKVLLAILVLSFREGRGRDCLGSTAPTAMIDDRRRSNLALLSEIIEVKTSKKEICEAVGVEAEGNSWVCVDNSITRLMGIVVVGKDGQRSAKTHLIHSSFSEDGGLSIFISARLASALKGGSYGSIPLPEFRNLGSVGRIMLLWLASWFGGSTAQRKIGIDRLEENIYGSRASDRKVRGKRNAAIRNAGCRLSTAGFYIDFEGRHALICRNQDLI